MDHYYKLFGFLAILATILLNLYKKQGKTKIPPGPKPWPIIGNIHMLGDKPHKYVAELVKRFGPIMSLKLGTLTTIVISSPEVAKEMFLKHDLALSSRQLPEASRETNHRNFSILWLPVGPKWRNLRKVVTVQLFSKQRLEASEDVRQNKVNELVMHARACCEKGLSVNIGKAGFTTSLNLLCTTIFSMDLSTYESLHSQEFKDVVWGIMEEVGVPNGSDFFPILRHFDLQGVRKRMGVHMNKMLRIFEEIIDERLRCETGGENDVLDTLLKLVKENELSLDNVKHLLLGDGCVPGCRWHIG